MGEHFILLALQIVAVTGTQYGGTSARHYGWVPLGEFASSQVCIEASKRLVVAGQPDARNSEAKASVLRFECLPTGASSR